MRLRGRTTDVAHGLSGQGRPMELPSGGIPRTSVDEDGDAVTFFVPAYPGHRIYFGGGKYPPPMVPPIRHADPMAYTEQKAN